MIRYLVPLTVFALIAITLWKGLDQDPSQLPSPLIGKPAPEFDLPDMEKTEQRFTRDDLLGKVVLLNVWATWCSGCRDEHALLLRIADKEQIPIYAFNYKDDRTSALDWLQRFGNPYRQIGFDASGRVGLDFGVYGLPETYVLDRDGIIRHKHIGPLTEPVWQREVLPVVKALRQDS